MLPDYFKEDLEYVKDSLRTLSADAVLIDGEQRVMLTVRTYKSSFIPYLPPTDFTDDITIMHPHEVAALMHDLAQALSDIAEDAK